MTTLCLVVSILCSPVALPARNPRMPWQVAVNNRSMRRRKQRKRATRERTDTLNEIEQLKTTNAELLKALAAKDAEIERFKGMAQVAMSYAAIPQAKETEG